MSSSMSGVVGAPRFDRGNRLRHRFYEPLFLLWILNRSRNPADVQPSVAEHSRRFPLTWRAFLDALSFVCDYEHGGGSVNSVAAESTANGTRFWLAARKQKAATHLQWTVHQLESLRDKEDGAVAEIERHITTKSIQFAEDKVAGYAKSFTYFLKRAKRSLDGSSVTVGSELLEALDDLASKVSHHDELTERAGSFDDAALSTLIHATSALSHASEWVKVRHQIQRLSAWTRACRRLVDFARHHPELFEGYSCEFLAIPEPLRLPKADLKTNLASALKRMVPAHEQSRARELYVSLTNLRDFGIEDAFVKAYSDDKISLFFHAEVFLMEHFHAKRLRFVAGDKYIGCSKPSCYCCSLYMRYHPGNFVVRRSHGNVWPKWSPPLSNVLDTEAHFKLNLEVMNKVIAHLRRDVIEEIENRAPRQQRLPDSTSDFPTVDLEAQADAEESDCDGGTSINR